jgi:hypothetical protein
MPLGQADAVSGRPSLQVGHYTRLHPLSSRGLLAFLRRGVLIGQRFGWTIQPMLAKIEYYKQLLHYYGVPGTLTIVANVARDHPRILDHLPAEHVELGVHGLRHVNAQQQAAACQVASVHTAVALFTTLGLSPHGWRSPYLLAGSGTVAAIIDRAFLWDASTTIVYPVVAPRLPRAKRLAWARAMAFYKPLPYEQHLSLPTLRQATVFFPTALPDDELLIDRLNLSATQCAAIWLDMLRRTHASGELLVLQLHPERIYHFQAALQHVLRTAKTLPVWIASLEQLARWWQARARTTLTVEATDDGYRVTAASQADVALQLLSPEAPAPVPLDGRRTITLAPGRWPGIGVCGRAAPQIVERLRADGFPAEVRVEGRDYAALFPPPGVEQLAQFERDLLRGRHLRSPMVKLSYWPGGYQSALAITGDLCSLNRLDFLKRYGRS